jgi:hypothetical protein
MPAGRTVVVGDVHGCLEELHMLLDLCGLSPGDRLVFVGDLIDRGPDPVGVVRLVRKLGAECLLGNHESKALAWRRQQDDLARKAEERRKKDPKWAPPVKKDPHSEIHAEWMGLSAEDLGWMRSELPAVLSLSERWLAVHAGFEDKPLGRQSEEKVLVTRFLWEDSGFMAPIGRDLRQPPGTVFWTERWRGPDSVVYGHHVHDLQDPRVDQCGDGVECVGIDTGCVFGGRLTAMILGPDGRS